MLFPMCCKKMLSVLIASWRSVQTFNHKKTICWIWVSKPKPKTKINLGLDSEFDSMHFGIENFYTKMISIRNQQTFKIIATKNVWI